MTRESIAEWYDWNKEIFWTVTGSVLFTMAILALAVWLSSGIDKEIEDCVKRGGHRWVSTRGSGCTEGPNEGGNRR